jgi:hypothetical protein
MGKTSLQPTSEELKHLYELSSELKALAPWRWMEEDDLFGVQNPETGEVGFVSVMGQLAEHTALAVPRPRRERTGDRPSRVVGDSAAASVV